MASYLFGAADPASRASEGKRLQDGETCQVCALGFVAMWEGSGRWKICIVGYDWAGKGKCAKGLLVRECNFLYGSRSSSLIFEASPTGVEFVDWDWEIAIRKFEG